MTVRTRFAPSPTGLLHIGGARTALFNYLFSRHHGGQFLLRVEDTDRARSTAANTAAILDSLDWLGLERDEPEVYQSTRAARHAEVAHAMLASGHAYRCWSTKEEIDAARDGARAAGRPLRFDSPWRDRTDGPDTPFVIRLRAPRDGETVVDDRVQGPIHVANAELDDMIILRSDGTPTYLHAVVVDDHDMRDHRRAARGRPPDQHLPSGADLPCGMGWELPRFGHLPLIHGAGRRQVVQAARRRFGLLEFKRRRATCPRRCATTCSASDGAHGDTESASTATTAIRLFDIDGVGRAASPHGLCEARYPGERRLSARRRRRPADRRRRSPSRRPRPAAAEAVQAEHPEA